MRCFRPRSPGPPPLIGERHASGGRGKCVRRRAHFRPGSARVDSSSPRPRVLAARKWRVSSREKFTKGRGQPGLGQNVVTVVTVPSSNFGALAWVPEGLLCPGSAKLAAQRNSCPRPQLHGFCAFCEERGLCGGPKRPGESAVIWPCKVPDNALKPVFSCPSSCPMLPCNN